jgi:hypothetical protein
MVFVTCHLNMNDQQMLDAIALALHVYPVAIAFSNIPKMRQFKNTKNI